MATKIDTAAEKQRILDAIKKARLKLQKRCEELNGHRPSDRHMLQTSPVWDYYKNRVQTDAVLTRCAYCGKVVYAEKMSGTNLSWLEVYFNNGHENQPLRGVAEPD